MTVNIPTSLEDISLDNWIKFDAINKEGSDEDFLIDKMIEIFCELPLKEVAKIPFNDAQDIYKDLVAVLNEESKFEPIINVDGTDFGFIPNLNEITLGEFVDLDNYLLSTKDLNKAMAVLYRPITYRNKDLYRIEEYDNPDKYKDVLGKQSVSFATGAVVFFLSFKQRINKTFPVLFPEGGEGGNEQDYSTEGQFAAKYGWLQSIYTLCKGDVTKFDQITKLAIHKALMWLEFEVEKIQLENKR